MIGRLRGAELNNDSDSSQESRLRLRPIRDRAGHGQPDFLCTNEHKYTVQPSRTLREESTSGEIESDIYSARTVR